MLVVIRADVQADVAAATVDRTVLRQCAGTDPQQQVARACGAHRVVQRHVAGAADQYQMARAHQLVLPGMAGAGRAAGGVHPLNLYRHAVHRDAVRFAQVQTARAGVRAQPGYRQFQVVAARADATPGLQQQATGKDVGSARAVAVTVLVEDVAPGHHGDVRRAGIERLDGDVLPGL